METQEFGSKKSQRYETVTAEARVNVKDSAFDSANLVGVAKNQIGNAHVDVLVDKTGLFNYGSAGIGAGFLDGAIYADADVELHRDGFNKAGVEFDLDFGSVKANVGANLDKSGFSTANATFSYQDFVAGEVGYDKNGLRNGTLRLKLENGNVWVNANNAGIVDYGIEIN